MTIFQNSSSALIVLLDFTTSKFESELCVSGTDSCHLNWLFISWHSASCCLGRVPSVPARVCPIWWAQRTHSWVVSSGEMIFFYWENGSQPRLFTGLFTLRHVLELFWKFMSSHIILLQPKQAYLFQLVLLLFCCKLL